MDVSALAKDLIDIPSYVDKTCDEKEIGEYVYSHLSKFSWLKVYKQPVVNGRFNVVAWDNEPTQLLLCGHLDTVEPREKLEKSFVDDEKVFGLGSSDMKGTVASMLSAVENLGSTKGLMLLFYIDEEYDFLGMNKFVEAYRQKINPKLIVGEGSDCQIKNGCRGLIEITFTLTGKTGHASSPEEGNNAIEGANQVIQGVSEFLKEFKNPVMGDSSLNVASINGGLNLGKKGEEILIGRQGNNIADICEFIVDIRPSTENLRAKSVIDRATEVAKNLGLKIEAKIRHDKPGWLSLESELPPEIVAKYPISTNYQYGYLDIQMLNEAFNCPCFGFGAGLSSQAHKKGEFVPVQNLQICQHFFEDLVRYYV